MLCKLLGDLLRLSSSGFREQIQIDFETFFAAISSPQSRLHARHIFDINLKTFVFIWQTVFLSAKKKRSFIDGMKTSSVFRLESGAPQRWMVKFGAASENIWARWSNCLAFIGDLLKN